MQLEKAKTPSEISVKPALWNLPYELISHILGYLEFSELKVLEAIPEVSKMFHQSEGSIFMNLYRQITNLQTGPELQAKVAKVEQIWAGRKIISLPFWGYKTDGGFLYQSIPFWVGKAFLKTHKPVIGLSTLQTGSFSGCISQDYYEFSNIVVNLSKLLRQVLQNDNFPEDIHQVNLKFVIMHTFHTDLDGATPEQRARFDELREKLYSYASRLSRFLEQQDGPNIENNEIIRLPLVANIHRVEISRNFKSDMYANLKNCVQTLAIGVSHDIPLKVLVKMPVPEIALTNMTKDEIQKFDFGYKPVVASHSEAKFIIFKSNSHGLLMWFDFGSTLSFKRSIPFEARVWTNEVHICMIRGKKEKSPFGLTLSYIEFKGIMI